MQEFLSIEHPFSGEFFQSTVFDEKAELNLSDFHRIGVECEIAARLSRDLSETGTPYDRGNVADAVGSLMAGIELVDDRYDDYTAFPTPILVTDDFFNSAFVQNIVGFTDTVEHIPLLSLSDLDLDGDAEYLLINNYLKHAKQY